MIHLPTTRLGCALFVMATAGASACAAHTEPATSQDEAHADNVAECAPTAAEKQPPLEPVTGMGIGSTSLFARLDGWAFAKETGPGKIPRPWVFPAGDPVRVAELTKILPNLGSPGIGDIDGDGLDEIVSLYQFGDDIFIGHESYDDGLEVAAKDNPTRSAWPIKGLASGDAGFTTFTQPTVSGLGVLDVDADKQLDVVAVTSQWAARVAYLDKDKPVAGSPTRTLKARDVVAFTAVDAPTAALKSIRFGDVYDDGVIRAVGVPVGSSRTAGTEAAPFDKLYVGTFEHATKQVRWKEFQFPGLLHITDAFPRRKNDRKTEVVIASTNKRGEAGVQAFALRADGKKAERSAFYALAELADTAKSVADWELVVKLIAVDRRSMEKLPSGEGRPKDIARYCSYLGPGNQAGAIVCWNVDGAGKPGERSAIVPAGQSIRGWFEAGNFGGVFEEVTYEGAHWGGAVAKPISLVFPPPSWTPFDGGVNSATATYGTSTGATVSQQRDTQVTRSTAIGRHYSTGGKIAGQEVQVSADFANATQKITGEIEATTTTKSDGALTTSRESPSIMYMESCEIHFVYKHKRGRPLGYRAGYVKDGLESIIITRPLKTPGGAAETWLRVVDLAKWNAKAKDMKRPELMIRDGGHLPPQADRALFQHVIPHVPGVPWTYYRSSFKPNDDKPAQIGGLTLDGAPIAALRYEHIYDKMVETKDGGDANGMSMEHQHDKSGGSIEGEGHDETQTYGGRATFTAGLPLLAEANTSIGLDYTIQDGHVTTTSRMTGKIASSSWSIDVPGLGGKQLFYNNKKPYTKPREITREKDKAMWERFHFLVKPYVYHYKLTDDAAIMVMDYALKFQSDPWFHPYRTDSDLVGGATKPETLKLGDRYCDRLFGPYVIQVTRGGGGVIVEDCNAALLNGVCWDPMAGDPARPQGKAVCLEKDKAEKEASLARLDVCPGPNACTFATCLSESTLQSPTGTVTTCAADERCAVVGSEAACVTAANGCVLDGVRVPDAGMCVAPGPGWTGQPDAPLIGGEVQMPQVCGPAQDRPMRIYCDSGVVRADPCSESCRVAGTGARCGEDVQMPAPASCPAISRCTGGNVEVCEAGAWHPGAACGGATCDEANGSAACSLH